MQILRSKVILPLMCLVIEIKLHTVFTHQNKLLKTFDFLINRMTRSENMMEINN